MRESNKFTWSVKTRLPSTGFWIFLKKNLKYWEVWAVDAIALNFSTEVDSIECYMGLGEIIFFKVTWCNQFKFLVFIDIKWVFRSFVFIQAIVFLNKEVSYLTEVNIACGES